MIENISKNKITNVLHELKVKGYTMESSEKNAIILRTTTKFALEYGEDEIQLHVDDIEDGWRVLLVDDLIATGGTIKAAAELLQAAGASAVEIFAVVGLPFLKYEKVLAGYSVTTLINYDSE